MTSNFTTNHFTKSYTHLNLPYSYNYSNLNNSVALNTHMKKPQHSMNTQNQHITNEKNQNYKKHSSYLTPTKYKYQNNNNGQQHTNNVKAYLNVLKTPNKIEQKYSANLYKSMYDKKQSIKSKSFYDLKKVDNYQKNTKHQETNYLQINKNKQKQQWQKNKNKSFSSFDNKIIEKYIKKKQQKESIDNKQITLKRNSSNISIRLHHKITINDFKICKKLGQGGFGEVFMVIHKKTNTLFALKKIKKQMIKNNFMQNQLMMQIKIQLFMNHPNVLKLYGMFDDHDYVYLLLQYMQEGTLYFKLKSKHTFNQPETSLIMDDVIKGINYLHSNNIAHRDIKPQNIVVSCGVHKLCDFGWAAFCPDQCRTTKCGTLDYSAPQILQGKVYGKSIDLWCLGVLAYQLLVGKAPFYHISRKQTMKKIINQEHDQLKFPQKISLLARDFINHLIKWDPDCRMQTSQALNHKFILQHKCQI